MYRIFNTCDNLTCVNFRMHDIVVFQFSTISLHYVRSFLTILIVKDSSKFGDIRCEDLGCIKLAQDKIQALLNTIIKLCIPWK